MSEPIAREEFDRVLDGVNRAEERMTERIDVGFDRIHDRLRKVETENDVMSSRLSLVERVMFAGVGLALASVALALLNVVLRQQ